MNRYESSSGVFFHCQICGCEMGTPNVIKCTNQTLTQGLLWRYNVCDICARAINDFIEERKETAHHYRELRDFFIKQRRNNI